jgi:hypothetical protein
MFKKTANYLISFIVIIPPFWETSILIALTATTTYNMNK